MILLHQSYKKYIIKNYNMFSFVIFQNYSCKMAFKSRYILKNAAELQLRTAVVEDAAGCLEYVEKVSGQSNFLTFGPGEFGLSLEEEENVIRDKASRVNELFLLGFIDDALVAQLTVNAPKRPRLMHAVEFGISVDSSVWGLGIGAAMIEYLLEWANNNPIIRKVNLQVLPQNTSAIKLYEKYGFAVEGRKLRDNLQNGVFSDVLLMGILID